MGSKRIDSSAPPTTANKLRRNSPGAIRRLGKAERGGGASVSEKLEALRNLVRSEAMKPEQLFQETAEYIVLLRTQVVVLQKLVDFYGSHQPRENPNSVQ